jgi:hypothetical protein
VAAAELIMEAEAVAAVDMLAEVAAVAFLLAEGAQALLEVFFVLNRSQRLR